MRKRFSKEKSDRSTRKHFSSQAVALGTTIALGVSIGAASPALANQPARPYAGTAVAQLSAGIEADSGRDFISSFFFGLGTLTEALSQLPSLAGLEALYGTEKSQEQEEAIEHILDEVDAANPGLFGRIGEQVQSGDPYLVNAALEEASDAVAEVIEVLSADLANGGLKDRGVSPRSLVVVVVVLFHAGALVTGFAVALVGAAVVAGGLYLTNGKSLNVSSAAQEAMVSDLTAALR